MQANKINVLIVDDHPVVLEGIRTILKDIYFVYVAGSCTNANSARTFLEEHRDIDVILMDINLPDTPGTELCAEVKRKYHHIHIIALSNYSERSMINQMIENGASGYILKNASSNDLLDAIGNVIHGKHYFSAEVMKELLQPSKISILPKLTRREKEILQLIAEGESSSIIAEKLFISQLTVETHRRNIIQKFQAGNMFSVIKIAIENKII